jgi:hypothetical protein
VPSSVRSRRRSFSACQVKATASGRREARDRRHRVVQHPPVHRHARPPIDRHCYEREAVHVASRDASKCPSSDCSSSGQHASGRRRPGNDPPPAEGRPATSQARSTRRSCARVTERSRTRASLALQRREPARPSSTACERLKGDLLAVEATSGRYPTGQPQGAPICLTSV